MFASKVINVFKCKYIFEAIAINMDYTLMSNTEFVLVFQKDAYSITQSFHIVKTDFKPINNIYFQTQIYINDILILYLCIEKKY